MPSKNRKLLKLFLQAGVFNLFHSFWGPNHLTVLAYHRVIDPDAPGFDTFKMNVSATPAAFAAQMDYLRRRFNVVSLDEVLAWLRGEGTLPPRPALITFDDGYRDNFDFALPVLRERNLPAVIFLATDYIGSVSPFYWDLVAYCFKHTRRTEAELPPLGGQRWSGEASRDALVNAWLCELKTIPDDDKWAAVRRLPQALGVPVPDEAFAGLHLSWDQVRAMVDAGIAMGAHTQSHPILTRVPLERARAEVLGSKARIEAEIGRPVTTLAYPNGLRPDFSPALQALLGESGFEAAFTLIAGPARLAEVRRGPLAIRRIYLTYKDTLPRFAAKVAGMPRLLGRPR